MPQRWNDQFKVIVSRGEVAEFNARWPWSQLRDRSYWFEFDACNRDLIDTDGPEQDDGSAALAMANDCAEWLFDANVADWMDI